MDIPQVDLITGDNSANFRLSQNQGEQSNLALSTNMGDDRKKSVFLRIFKKRDKSKRVGDD